jgi:UDP-N-acetylmuramoyl-L-alanyl-D-glutamate--2,6-diaminopimelate ligase
VPPLVLAAAFLHNLSVSWLKWGDMMVDAGREFAVVETTSHGLSGRTNRLGDVAFDAAVLTNVTHEHLEFHGSFEQYRSDKANLFRSLSTETVKTVACPRFGVVNAGDPSAAYFRECARVPVVSYGVGSTADLMARSVESEISGASFLLAHEGREVPCRVSIPGPGGECQAGHDVTPVRGRLD